MVERQMKSNSVSGKGRMSVEEKAVHRNDARRQAGTTGGKRAAEHRKQVPERGKPRSQHGRAPAR